MRPVIIQHAEVLAEPTLIERIQAALHELSPDALKLIADQAEVLAAASKAQRSLADLPPTLPSRIRQHHYR